MAIVLLLWSEILQNSSCVCVAVDEILTTLELALPEEEIQKHVHSTQYGCQVLKNVDCFMSLHRCYLDKAGTFFFRNSTMQRYKGNVGCCLFQNSRIRRPAVAFDILSALMLSTYCAKGSVMTAKQTPYMHPWLWVHVSQFGNHWARPSLQVTIKSASQCFSTRAVLQLIWPILSKWVLHLKSAPCKWWQSYFKRIDYHYWNVKNETSFYWLL